MSVYASLWGAYADEHDETCDRWVPCGRDEAYASGAYMVNGGGRYARLDGDSACTCLCGPVGYGGSHVVPDAGSKRRGSVDVAAIPGFITWDGRPAPGHDEADYEDAPYWPFLRLAVNTETVVLDRRHVGELYRLLGDWLIVTPHVLADDDEKSINTGDTGDQPQAGADHDDDE